MSGLKKKLISGFGYMAIAKYSGFIINLLVTAILARILAPEVFGIVSIANIFIGIFSVISDFGIASAIVQNQTFDEKDYSNVFSITVYFSLILAAIFLLLLYPLNLVYKSKELINNTLDQIPKADKNAKRIVALIKESGRITGYKLSDESYVSKPQAVSMAKNGQIVNVAIAHKGNTEYLKSIPDGTESNNLGNLPSVTPE